MKVSDGAAMRVLVTGATGSLGLPLCLHLKDRGYEVVGIGRNADRLRILENAGITVLNLDLCNGNLASRLPTVDAVVHSAALTRPYGPAADFVGPNLTATENLMEWALAAGVQKFVHISTTAIYYDGTSKNALTENSPLPVRHKVQYAATKLESEKIALRMNERGLPVIILRPRAILSPYDQTLLPRLLPLMKRGRFPLIAGGEALIDVTPVESIASAIELALQALPKFRGQIYNLTNDEPISIRNLMTWVSDSLGLRLEFVNLPSSVAAGLGFTVENLWHLRPGSEPPVSRYALDLISKSQNFDISKIKKDLGYRPVLSTREAIAKTGASFR